MVTLTKLGAERQPGDGPDREVEEAECPFRMRRCSTTRQTASRTSSPIPAGLTFHREDVDIASVDGDTVELADGPPVGTRVVTVGLPQIHGAEL